MRTVRARQIDPDRDSGDRHRHGPEQQPERAAVRAASRCPTPGALLWECRLDDPAFPAGWPFGVVVRGNGRDRRDEPVPPFRKGLDEPWR